MGTRTPSLLLRRQVERSGARIFDRTMVTGLLLEDGAVTGAVGFPMDHEEVVVFRAGAVVLAAGAGGFKPLGWPIASLTSDGDAMAYRAGATIGGKEFSDPHACPADRAGMMAFGRFGRPGDDGRPRFGPIVNAEGDEVPRAGTLFLDLEFEAHAGRAPLTMQLEDGDVPVVGGGASGMGVHKTEGVWPAGLDCSSGVPGLYAAGDALGTMQSGATYAAIGQSIANCAVTGARAGAARALRTLRQRHGGAGPPAAAAEVARAREELLTPLRRRGGFSPRWVTRVLQDAMLPYFVLYVKHGDRLRRRSPPSSSCATTWCPSSSPATRTSCAWLTRRATWSSTPRCACAPRCSAPRAAAATTARTSRGATTSGGWRGCCSARRTGAWADHRAGPRAWRPDPAIPCEERYPLRYPGE